MRETNSLVDLVRPLLGEVDVVDDLTFSRRAQVVRLRLASGMTVVAKQHKEAVAFQSEKTALRTLPPGVGPTLLGVADSVLVMEDLGIGPSLADLLLGDDPDAAHQGLLGWAQGLGHVAADTTPPHDAPATRLPRPDVHRTDEALRPLGVAMPYGWADELAAPEDRLTSGQTDTLERSKRGPAAAPGGDNDGHSSPAQLVERPARGLVDGVLPVPEGPIQVGHDNLYPSHG